ncbi:MAG: hypothetical protein M1825_004213 [Sarcosagium campestre]|nr:MAG: hypothetical protein M1825_004213 [Sarcosagium campestre]
MSSTKASLKAAKAALDEGNYDEAVIQARKVLAVDANNYHANIFLGLALDKQNHDQDAELAYLAATKIKDGDVLAWQGLVSLYERIGVSKLDRYGDAAIKAARIYMNLDDKTRCQTVIDKYQGIVKRIGTRSQQKAALLLLLPSGPFYDYLEGRLPHPSLTLKSIAAIVEEEEKARINKEIGERRTRLGAKIGDVTRNVKCEVLRSSELERIYQDIIDWSHDDESRREFEEKQLQHAYMTLEVLPAEEKEQKRAVVEKLARGIVIIKHPFKLAWDIFLEWKDAATLDAFDPLVLQAYVGFFPESGLGRSLRAFENSALWTHVKKTDPSRDDGEADNAGLSSEECLLIMMDGVEASPGSMLSHRILAEYYLHLEEYEAAADTSRTAKNITLAEILKTGLKLHLTVDAISITLGSALIYYQTPRNHPEARKLFDEVLLRDPTSTAALVGVGLILEEEEEFQDAVDFLSRALDRDPSNTYVRVEAAWCRALNGHISQGLAELETCLSQLRSDDRRGRELKAKTLYRIGVCLWELNDSFEERKNRKGAYARFLASLQANPEFAPAYTILGIYYADYAKDRKRARKCFQKSFELSASEVIAAERLSRAFADQADWDLVEIVAQRVVDSGKVRPTPGSKRRGVSWPFAALGAVELNKQDYAKSIVSFQMALRISPDDYHCWVGLGESYHDSGRYTAAAKALQQAELVANTLGLMDQDTWWARYMLANVKREVGEFDAAVSGYEDVLGQRPHEFGVLTALGQTLVEGAWNCLETGFFGKASTWARRAVEAIEAAISCGSESFNLWKALGDACTVFTFSQSHLQQYPRNVVSSLLAKSSSSEWWSVLEEIDRVSMRNDDSIARNSVIVLEECIDGALLARKRALHIASADKHSHAVAWYNLGWTECRAYACLSGRQSGGRQASRRFLNAAVRCFKNAIEAEAGNSDYWNALGVATTLIDARIAQHSFVRSLFLSDKSARAWTNLGVLYLLQDDFQLANDAFTRAQSTDPDFAQAWLGQGFLALLFGDPNEALLLMTHSYEISDASCADSKRQYALAVFDDMLTNRRNLDAVELIQPIFALYQLELQSPDHWAYSHLYSLLLERVGVFEGAAAKCTKLELLEQNASGPDSATLNHTQAVMNADMARFHYSTGNYDEARRYSEKALALSTKQSLYRKPRLSAIITEALSRHQQGTLSAGAEELEKAATEDDIEDDDGNRKADMVCLWAQLLWAQGDKDGAKSALFDSIESSPGHVRSVMLLGAMAILGDDDDDNETLEAVFDDLQSLRTSSSEEESQRAADLLSAIAALSGSGSSSSYREDSTAEKEMTEAMRSIMLSPAKQQGWSQLAALVVDDDDSFPARMALKTMTARRQQQQQQQHHEHHGGDSLGVSAQDLARAHVSVGTAANMQRAVMLAPWVADGWEGLHSVISARA